MATAPGQSVLVRGSSSVMSGDTIVGLTWDLIVRTRCMPWLDRVASESTPVDGLSLGRLMGPWSSVVQANVPSGLLARIGDELK